MEPTFYSAVSGRNELRGSIRLRLTVNGFGLETSVARIREHMFTVESHNLAVQQACVELARSFANCPNDAFRSIEGVWHGHRVTAEMLLPSEEVVQS